MGAFYFRMLEYRKSTAIMKQKNFKIIHFVQNSKICTIFMYIYAITSLNFITGVTLTANQNGYNWTDTQNVVFFSLSRL